MFSQNVYQKITLFYLRHNDLRKSYFQLIQLDNRLFG